jgi:hypothetical protein
MNDLDQLLAQAADRLPDTPDRLAGVLARRAHLVRRRRVRTAAAATVAVAGAAAVAVAVVSGGGASPRARLLPGDGATSASQLYGATGRVVSVPGRPVRFCAPVGSDLVLRIPTPPPAYCDFGVDVVGVDLARLTARREAQGAIEGEAALTGTLANGVLHVVRQSEALPPEGPRTYDTPPCPEPAGGWPTGATDANLDLTAMQTYASAHPDQVVEVAFLRPSSRQVLAYVLTTGDVQQAENALRPSYGKSLCVFSSRFTKAQQLAARADPAFAGGPRTQVYGSGDGLGRDGQIESYVSATILTPELEAAVARHPKGLVRLDLFLNPVANAP